MAEISEKFEISVNSDKVELIYKKEGSTMIIRDMLLTNEENATLGWLMAKDAEGENVMLKIEIKMA